MANWTTLKTAIASIIKTNGNQEITGQLLQNVLNSIINAVGENMTFVGMAEPTTSPGVPDGPVFYIALQKGTYSNFNGLTVTDSPKMFIWKNSSWGAIDLLIYTKEYIDDIYEKLNSSISTLGEYIQCGGFLRAYIDAENKILIGLTKDGNVYIPNRRFFEEINSAENFLELTLDAKNKIINYRAKDGTLHENSICVEKSLGFTEESLSELKNTLEKAGLNVKSALDFSDAKSLRIQTPSFGYINITEIDSMPTSKTDDKHAVFEFWSMNGAYFKKKVILNAQGSSSMAYPKKNFAVDFCNDNWIGDDTFELKIGNWVPQDSFHFKAYYTDAFRGIGVICYKLNEEIMQTRDYKDNRPYKYLFANSYKTVSDGADTISDIDKNFDSGARCFPDGFPVSVYLNGEFYGVFSWQLKKHRDNYWMDKKNTNHIHLDGTLSSTTFWGGTIDWTAFEIRNPKGLITLSGGKYDGDNPTEIIGINSSNYDSSNSGHVKTAAVKSRIERLAQSLSELNTFIQTETDTALIKAKIESYFNASFLVDYILLSEVISNGDGFAKNWQWTTWDGEKWVANMYDLDGTFGANHLGLQIAPPLYGSIGNNMSIPTGWIWKYYRTELLNRYKELRDKGIISKENISKIITAWCDAIGANEFAKELKKWNETPAYRKSYLNSEYWKAVSYSGSAITYDSAKSYTAGDTCVFGHVSAYGVQFTFTFECIKPCQGIIPVTNFYDSYPQMLGHYDSVYRLINWIEAKIQSVDIAFNYN